MPSPLKGISSINRTESGMAFAKFTSGMMSFSLIPAITTAFILVGISWCSKASKVCQTCLNSSRRVMAWKRFGSVVSKLKLMEAIPKALSSATCGSVSTPFVVICTCLIPSISCKARKNCIKSRRKKGSPPVILTFSIPISAPIRQRRSISSKLNKCGLGKYVIPSAGIQ